MYVCVALTGARLLILDSIYPNVQLVTVTVTFSQGVRSGVSLSHTTCRKFLKIKFKIESMGVIITGDCC